MTLTIKALKEAIHRQLNTADYSCMPSITNRIKVNMICDRIESRTSLADGWDWKQAHNDFMTGLEISDVRFEQYCILVRGMRAMNLSVKDFS